MAKRDSKRILYGITKSNFGGAQRYVLALASAAQKQGHRVAVLCGQEGSLTHRLRSEGVEVISLPYLGRDISPLHDIRSFLEIMHTLHEWRPDILHINSSKMGALGSLAARTMRVPTIVFTAHGWAFNEDRPLWQKPFIKLLHWLTILLSHKTICVSAKSLQDVRHWPFISKKLTVVRNGLSPFPLLEVSAARKYLSLPPDTSLVVGALSELHHSKGLDILLEAWAHFLQGESHENALLVIVGSGEARPYLEKLARELGVGERVVFAGFIEDARAYLKALDIFVIPSRTEGLPFSLLEAGYASLPVIATSVGGMPEVIGDDENGLLVPPGDVSSLSAALERLASDSRLRQVLGSKLHASVNTLFSEKRMLEETLSLY